MHAGRGTSWEIITWKTKKEKRSVILRRILGKQVMRMGENWKWLRIMPSGKL
jgi:hypothetical protein